MSLLDLSMDYDVAGIYQNQAEVTAGPSYDKARVGGFKFRDVNGDGQITPADRTIIGNPNPDFIYSFSLNANYKNFDIAMFFNGVQGNDLYDATRYFTDFQHFRRCKKCTLARCLEPNQYRKYDSFTKCQCF